MYRVAILTVIALPIIPGGRAIEDWPYEKLLLQADLVVIGKAVSSVESGEKSNEGFLGVNTTFDVKGVLKGQVDGKQIKLLHYRIKGGNMQLPNGPLLVTFRTTGFLVTSKKGGETNLSPPEYLLFLKIRKDGRYEAVSGQYDPKLSVRQMFAAFSEDPGN